MSEIGNDTRRLIEMVKVISKYALGGMNPDKFCDMMKELGPTYVKLGQLLSMHPEVIPMEYCKKLENLRTDASHLVTSQIRDIISDEYGKPWTSVFQRIMPFPLGAASIAQVHEAILLDGTHVAVKIQRPDIYATMERDVRLLKKAFSIVRIKGINDVVDLSDTLEQMWIVAKQEMDFIQEAENIRTLRKNCEGIEYIYCPKVYDEFSTKNVLVMEYIGGCELCDKEALLADGYDLEEVCTKFVNNFIKQFAEDLFFHADPHPGNVRVWNGRVVWLDLGMMGRLSREDAELVKACMRAIVTNDYKTFANAVLDICAHDPNINMDKFYERMRLYLDKYRIISMEEMSSTVDIFADLYRISRDFGIQVPTTYTMFWRSMSVMEGTVSDLSPKTDLAAIIGKHLAAQNMIGGIAGAITKSVSHKRLISGKPLSYNGHEQTEDEEIPDEE